VVVEPGLNQTLETLRRQPLENVAYLPLAAGYPTPIRGRLHRQQGFVQTSIELRPQFPLQDFRVHATPFLASDSSSIGSIPLFANKDGHTLLRF
jgi:hypothetical protein